MSLDDQSFLSPEIEKYREEIREKIIFLLN
jgi:hypothetical protein